ncbi:unnamed protein product [Pleuronectes platessa]|uniref:Uncharacterized protein n=1 Tax=Pleuronectes platessa TaxID=8262 RepID=A0A9N7YGE7_PLEPL|nr:unnamed protein product [Pleuronectes platessa]
MIVSTVGRLSSAGTATVEMPDTSEITNNHVLRCPSPSQTPPVHACGRGRCCVCVDFQSVEATDGPAPYALRQPSVS